MWPVECCTTGLISPSLTLSVSCQSSLPIAAAVHNPSVNSPSNQPPTSSPYLFSFFLLFCTPVFLLSQGKLLNCNYFSTMAYLLPYLLTTFAHTVYRCSIVLVDCTRVYPMRNCCVIDCTFVYPISNCFVIDCVLITGVTVVFLS